VDGFESCSLKLSKWYRKRRRKESSKCVETLLKNWHSGYIKMDIKYADTLWIWGENMKHDENED
jgi:hypothetical protein